jgi:hypothetical protein
MKHLTIFILTIALLVTAMPALADDSSNAGDIVAFGDCLSALDVSRAKVGYYTNRTSQRGQQSFTNAPVAGEYEAFASLQVRNIWYGYGNITPRGYDAIDWPGGRVVPVYEWLNLTSFATGDAFDIRVVWSEQTPNEYYILPMKHDNHGGGGCRFYSVGVNDFWSVMAGFNPA